MIDEDRLEDEIARFAAGIEPDPDHRSVLLELADAPGGRLSAITRPGRVRTRFVGVAASLVLVAGTALVTWGTTAGPSLSTAVRSTPGAPGTHGAAFSPIFLGTRSGQLYVPNGSATFGADVQGVSASPNGVKGTSRASGSVALGPRIESTGSVNLRVAKDGVSSTLARLAALATADGGSVSSMNETASAHRGGRATFGYIVLSVPQGRFGQLVGQVQRLGRATSVRTNSVDVTSQYVDLRSRISALQVSRHQYLAIMAKATTIGGILAVQNQIDSLQSQIEQLQGQLNVLNHQTAYGSLAVSVSAPTPPKPAPHHRSGVARAWDGSVGGFVRAIEGLIRVSGPALFVLLCLGALGVLGRGLWRYVVRRRL